MPKYNEGDTVTVNGQIMTVAEYLPAVPDEFETKGIMGCEAVYFLIDGDGEGEFFRAEDID